MRIFILNVSKLTPCYHSGGGLVVIAEDLAAAKNFVSKLTGAKITEAEWSAAVAYDLTESAKPSYFVFPDAGCC